MENIEATCQKTYVKCETPVDTNAALEWAVRAKCPVAIHWAKRADRELEAAQRASQVIVAAHFEWRDDINHEQHDCIVEWWKALGSPFIFYKNQ